MSRFKVGDLVTPISVKPYSDRIQRRLLGKTLVIYSFQDNGNSFLVFAGVIGDCGFFWHPDDLRLVSETQAEPTDPAPAAVAEVPAAQPERTHAETTIRQFKPGDYVVPLVVDRDEYVPEMKKLLGKVLQIPPVFVDHAGISIRAGKIGAKTKKWFWHPDDLRLATAEEIAASKKPKPIRRGDLVEYQGDICVVFSKGADRDGEYYGIAPLTSDSNCYYADIGDLTRIGSISKKIKRLQAKMEGAV